MKAYWYSLQARERRLILLATAAVVVFLLYALVWVPYDNARQALEQQVATSRADVAYMSVAAAEIRRLQGTGGHAGLPAGRSLLAVVDASAKAHGLGAALKRLAPEANNRLRISLEPVGFDDLLRWLAELNRRYGIGVDSLTASATTAPGEVSAQVTLKGPGQ